VAAGDALRAIVEKIVRDTMPIREYNVTAVGPTTVSLGYGSNAITDVPCSSAYAHRAVGDRVLVLRSAAGNWTVLCRSEALDPTP
jgi:hypothetical protein